jgi:uridine phosphorylase
MVDFLAREARQIIPGPMALVRYGTCGVMHPDVHVGDIIVPKDGSIIIQDNYDFDPETDDKSKAYHVSKCCKGDEVLHDLLIKNFEREVATGRVATGIDVTADGFYSTQGYIL